MLEHILIYDMAYWYRQYEYDYRLTLQTFEVGTFIYQNPTLTLGKIHGMLELCSYRLTKILLIPHFS